MRAAGVGRFDRAALGLGLAAGLVAALATAAGPRGALIAAGVLAAGFALAAASIRPDIALCLAILSIPLQAPFLSEGSAADAYTNSSFGLTPPEILFMLTGYGWALARVVQRRIPLAIHALSPPLVLLVLSLLPGLLLARDPFAVVKVLVNWVAFLMVFQMIAADADERLLRRIFTCLTLAGAVAGLMAILGTNVATQAYDQATNTSTSRASGPFAHPAQLSVFLLLVVPAAVALALRGPRALRLPAAAAAVVSVVGIALALSRGALIALGAGLAVFLGWAPFRRAVLALVALFIVASLAGFSPAGQFVNVRVLTQRLTSTREAVAGADPRINIYRQTPRMIRDHLPFGVGANNFYLNAADYSMYDPTVRSAPGHAHNIALNITAEEGLLGLGALTWFAVVLVRTLVSLLGRSHGVLRAYTMAAASALFALTLYGLTDYPLIVNVLAAITFVWAGCVPALDRLVGRPLAPRA